MTEDRATAKSRSREEIDQPNSLVRRIFEPLTFAVFAEAGLQPGMRVLDVFSGNGDVALLAREFVGPEGYVTGFDMSAEAVVYANERAAFRRLNNVSFIESRIEDLPEDEFDAVVGRAVLMYRPDPARDLRQLARCVRPGGLVAFQEVDLLQAKTVPPVALIEDVRKWLLITFARAGVELEMGPKLYSTFKAAGLGPPEMRADAFVGGVESDLPALLADTIGMLKPELEAQDVPGTEEFDIHTLEERVRAELARTGGVMLSAMLIGAWARLPQ